MKAATSRRYGGPGVLEIEEMPMPDPGSGEVLVKVRAAAVTTADWRLRASAFPSIMWLPGRLMFGLFKPKYPVLGGAFAGEVAAVGQGVSRFSAGDRVFGIKMTGAHAQYVVMPEAGALAPLPDGLDFVQAAAIPFGGLAALVFLRDFGDVGAGDHVLVAGASGGVGSYAVQIARHFGAEVTGMASGANGELVRSLGASTVIDYTKEDFSRRFEKFDIVLDPVGATRFSQAKRVLTPDGRYVPLEFALGGIMQAIWTAMAGGPKVKIGVSGESREDLEFLGALAGSGELRPLVDSVFALDQIAEAHRRVETRHARGTVIVEPWPSANEADG